MLNISKRSAIPFTT